MLHNNLRGSVARGKACDNAATESFFAMRCNATSWTGRGGPPGQTYDSRSLLGSSGPVAAVGNAPWKPSPIRFEPLDTPRRKRGPIFIPRGSTKLEGHRLIQRAVVLLCGLVHQPSVRVS
jgi:hypothetical protein